MRLALFWSEILHYHAARIKALQRMAKDQGCSVFPFALRPSVPGLPDQGYHDLQGGTIKVLSSDPCSAGLFARISQSQVIGFLNQYQPDAVGIPGYSSPVTIAALDWCRRLRRGAILMSDSKANDYGRSAVKELLKRRLVPCFDAALVAGSPQVAYTMELGMRDHRVFTGVDAVDNDFWSERSERVRGESEDWRARLRLPQHFFLTVCRLVPNKNVAGLLRAYGSYSRQSPEVWPLVIAGDGRLMGELERLAIQLGVAGQVRFVGYLHAVAMVPYYALASVFILATGTSETWGLVVNEAMAAGIPVLVSNICGCVADLVVEGKTGFSFDPQDEKALANLMSACSDGRFDLKSMGLLAKKQVERFSPRAFAGGFLAAAKAATEHAGGRRTGFLCRLYLAAIRSALRMPSQKLE